MNKIFHLSDNLKLIQASALNNKKKINIISMNDEILKLTDSCIKKIQSLIFTNPEILIRISVDGGGCKGFQYVYTEEKISNIVSSKGYDTILCFSDKDIIGDEEYLEYPLIVFDRFSKFYIEKSIFDYEDSFMFSGFIIKNNPKADSSCSCKKSFSSDAIL